MLRFLADRFNDHGGAVDHRMRAGWRRRAVLIAHVKNFFSLRVCACVGMFFFFFFRSLSLSFLSLSLSLCPPLAPLCDFVLVGERRAVPSGHPRGGDPRGGEGRGSVSRGLFQFRYREFRDKHTWGELKKAYKKSRENKETHT